MTIRAWKRASRDTDDVDEAVNKDVADGWEVMGMSWGYMTRGNYHHFKIQLGRYLPL